MARKNKAATAAVETPVETPVETNALGNMANVLTAPAPAPTLKGVALVTPAQLAAGVTVAGVTGVTASRCVVAMASRKGGLNSVPAVVAGTSYKLAKVPRCKPGYTLTSLTGIQACLAANGGTATGAQLAAASTGNFVQYALKPQNSWLVKA